MNLRVKGKRPVDDLIAKLTEIGGVVGVSALEDGAELE